MAVYEFGGPCEATHLSLRPEHKSGSANPHQYHQDLKTKAGPCVSLAMPCEWVMTIIYPNPMRGHNKGKEGADHCGIAIRTRALKGIIRSIPPSAIAPVTLEFQYPR